jgi:ZIP family zinc transporter
MIATGENVAVAFALNIAAGLATCIGGSVIFSKRLVQLANPKSLSIALSLSAGVMLFISLVEIYGKSVEGFAAGFGEDNEAGEYECDATCEGNSWLASTACFITGFCIIYVMDWIMHKISPDFHEELEAEDFEALAGVAAEPAHEGFHHAATPKSGSKEAIKFNARSRHQLNRTGVLTAVAIAMHNLPEGVATYIAAMKDIRVGAVLAIGIALHNIPEGIAVATPVYFATDSRCKAFMWTFISALAEPLGGVLAWLIVGEGLNPLVEGAMFGIVTGMMVTISIKELIPTAVKYYPQGHAVTVAIFGGMLIMATSLILFAYAGV